MLKNTISNTQVICVKLMFTVNQFISAFLFLPLFFRDAVTKTVTERLTLSVHLAVQYTAENC